MEETKKTERRSKTVALPPELARVARAFDEARDAVIAALAMRSSLPGVTAEVVHRQMPSILERAPMRPEVDLQELSATPRAPRVNGVDGLTKCEHGLLRAAALRHPRRSSIAQLLAIADYRVTGTSNQAIAALRRAGYLDGPGEELTITEDGMAKLPDVPEIPAGLIPRLEMWKGMLNACAQKLLAVYVGHHPHPLTFEQVLAEAGYKATGTTNQAVARLRLLELIEGQRGGPMRASDYLIKGP